MVRVGLLYQVGEVLKSGMNFLEPEADRLFPFLALSNTDGPRFNDPDLAATELETKGFQVMARPTPAVPPCFQRMMNQGAGWRQ